MSYTLFSDFHSSSTKQFLYYRQLGEQSIHALNDEDLFTIPTVGSNSIAVIVKHLSGNMKSRWTDLFTSDGEKEWRNRDAEFEVEFTSREALMNYWNAGWDTLFLALDAIDEENYDKLVYIRNQGHTVVEAMNRQLCHYSYHIGQMVFLAKLLKGNDWTSLSIPKDKSASYNSEQFEKEKGKGHFTDTELK